jgi:DNA-binding NtrC family response regulator
MNESRLPLSRSGEADIENAVKNARQNEPAVLVVDNDAGMLEEIGRFLQTTGRRPLLVRDSRQAIVMLRENSAAIRAVIVNFNMPDMDGDHLLQQLRRAQDGIRIVLCMRNSRQEIMRRSPEPGVVAYLRHPFSLLQLADAVYCAVNDRS